jgi:hypothetical protein
MLEIRTGSFVLLTKKCDLSNLNNLCEETAKKCVNF